jgi:REP element-mobilizing transposase RayT
LRADGREELFRYILGIIRNKNSHLYRINAVEDHLHILSSLHPSVALADFIKDIKVASNGWIQEQKVFPRFNGWQDGYGAFTASHEDKDRLIDYIKNQQEHHRKETFLEEYRRLLKEAGIEFDEQILNRWELSTPSGSNLSSITPGCTRGPHSCPSGTPAAPVPIRPATSFFDTDWMFDVARSECNEIRRSSLKSRRIRARAPSSSLTRRTPTWLSARAGTRQLPRATRARAPFREVWTRDTEFDYRNRRNSSISSVRSRIRPHRHRDVRHRTSNYHQGGLVQRSAVTPAARASHTTDVWAVRHGCHARGFPSPERHYRPHPV